MDVVVEREQAQAHGLSTCMQHAHAHAAADAHAAQQHDAAHGNDRTQARDIGSYALARAGPGPREASKSRK